MQADLDILFQPFTCKSLELKNRIVMAPMTRNFCPDGIPGENVAAYYLRRAEADVGLILSEGTLIDRPAAGNHPDVPDFHGSAALSGWQNVVNRVHSAVGRIAPQIWHVGAMPDTRAAWSPEGGAESPSGIYGPDLPNGHALSDEDLADCIASYGRAAEDARRLGFDAVEVHGAHGYLIDQFFWSKTNLRDDRYGGATLVERSRFALEVLRAIRQAVGEDFPIILRISQWKQMDYGARLATTPDEMAAWLCPLAEGGVDIFHCSQRRFWEPEFPEIDGADGMNLAGWAKRLTGAPTISVGSVGLSEDLMASAAGDRSSAADLSQLIRRMEREEFDLIAVGRALLADPEWVRKVRHNDAASLTGFSPEAFATLY